MRGSAKRARIPLRGTAPIRREGLFGPRRRPVAFLRRTAIAAGTLARALDRVAGELALVFEDHAVAVEFAVFFWGTAGRRMNAAEGSGPRREPRVRQNGRFWARRSEPKDSCSRRPRMTRINPDIQRRTIERVLLAVPSPVDVLAILRSIVTMA